MNIKGLHVAALFFCFTQAKAVEFFGQINPRFDAYSAEAGSVTRPLVKLKAQAKSEHFQFYADGFVDDDYAGDFDEKRRDSGESAVQELYGELNYDAFYLRVGRQANRWSESWALPSLDVWTGRRWNRGFIDPLSETLIHSDAVLATYTINDIQVDGIYVWQGARSKFPEPLAEYIEAERKNEFGTRVKVPYKDFNFNGVYASLEAYDVYGLSVTYAFSEWVPKLETGRTSEEDWFATLGIDGFWGKWTLTPQVTAFQGFDDTQSKFTTEWIYYLSITFKGDKWEFESQAFANANHQETFASLLGYYNFTPELKAGAFVQNYDTAEEFRLFSLYRDYFGTVVGARIEMNIGATIKTE